MSHRVIPDGNTTPNQLGYIPVTSQQGTQFCYLGETWYKQVQNGEVLVSQDWNGGWFGGNEASGIVAAGEKGCYWYTPRQRVICAGTNISAYPASEQAYISALGEGETVRLNRRNRVSNLVVDAALDMLTNQLRVVTAKIDHIGEYTGGHSIHMDNLVVGDGNIYTNTIAVNHLTEMSTDHDIHVAAGVDIIEDV